MPKSQPTPLFETLSKLQEIIKKRRKYVKNDFQAYGLQLAESLDDWKNRSLYIRLAKTVDRQILDTAFYFVKDQTPGTIKTPYKLFMWKLKELRKPKPNS
jgi:hypothetical protein